jgi:hypothetical protein
MQKGLISQELSARCNLSTVAETTKSALKKPFGFIGSFRYTNLCNPLPLEILRLQNGV